MNDNKYVTMVYNMLLNDLQINENKKSWVSGIKNTLQSLGLNDVQIFRQLVTKKYFQNQLKGELIVNTYKRSMKT